MNDLDRAILALGRSHSALPDLMRQLALGDLWFLVAYHPEVEGEHMEFKNGMRMPFIQFEDSEGPIIPIFSSHERLRESLQKSSLSERAFSAGTMIAQQLLEILGKADLRAVLNKGCQTGEMILPANMMRDIADGTAFQVIEGPEPEEAELIHGIDAADFPTDLIQPAFEVLRKHPEFRAAWIVRRKMGETTPRGGVYYQFLVLMDPRDPVASHDLNLVLQAACNPADEANLGYINEWDPEHIASIASQIRPFYLAPGYELPTPPSA